MCFAGLHVSARQGLTENCRFLIEHTGGSIAKELDNQVYTCSYIYIQSSYQTCHHQYCKCKILAIDQSTWLQGAIQRDTTRTIHSSYSVCSIFPGSECTLCCCWEWTAGLCGVPSTDQPLTHRHQCRGTQVCVHVTQICSFCIESPVTLPSCTQSSTCGLHDGVLSMSSAAAGISCWPHH